MKRYETPMVELTKFDVEDVITVSATNPNLDKDAAINDIKAFAIDNTDSDEAGYGNNVFAW